MRVNMKKNNVQIASEALMPFVEAMKEIDKKAEEYQQIREEERASTINTKLNLYENADILYTGSCNAFTNVFQFKARMTFEHMSKEEIEEVNIGIKKLQDYCLENYITYIRDDIYN